MNLKLAEYKDEKFERFLKLGEDFGYCGKFIIVTTGALDLFFKYSLPRQPNQKEACEEYVVVFKKDEKDPLNRFNGLFNGRTFGNGRFVLIETPNRRFDEVFSIKNFDVIKNDGKYYVYKDGVPTRYDDSLYGWHWKVGYCGFINKFENVGNLIENPELWEKIK
jgi:hypothetical protein